MSFATWGYWGLCNISEAIEIVLSGLSYDTCLCYFDDVIIPSSSLQQHCKRLVSVLERFRKHNLRVKAKKCCFGAKCVRFLGHIVSAEGVHTDSQKLDIVSKLPVPSNVQQVRSFLGPAGYYRRFILNFAAIASPLVALTKKDKKFSWTDAEKEALAVIYATNYFRPYLLGKKFTVVTDHSVLRWLHSVEPKGRLARWVMCL